MAANVNSPLRKVARTGENARRSGREPITQRQQRQVASSLSLNPYWAGHVSGRRRRDAERPDLGARAVRRARVKQSDAPSRRLGGGGGPELRGSKPGLCCSGWHDDLFLAATRCLSVGAESNA